MAKTGHPNFVYKISSIWRGGRHTWSLTGNHSGSSLSGADAQNFLIGADSPFALSYAPFLTSGFGGGGSGYVDQLHQVVGAAYYDGQNSAPVYEIDYNVDSPPPTALTPTGAAFAGTSDQYGALEGCVELRASVGLSKTNKPVYVRKFIHGLCDAWVSNDVASQSLSLVTLGHTAMQNQSNGSWYGSRVYIAPSGNQPTASAWQALPGAHQMPRGRRKTTAKAGASAQSTLLRLIEGVGEGVAANLITDFL